MEFIGVAAYGERSGVRGGRIGNKPLASGVLAGMNKNSAPTIRGQFISQDHRGNASECLYQTEPEGIGGRKTGTSGQVARLFALSQVPDVAHLRP